MNNQDLREILLKELDFEGIPTEAQNEVVSQLGEIILQSLVVTLYKQLLPEARKEFDALSKAGNPEHIHEFLEQNIPHVQELMQEEVQKTIRVFKERSVIK